jgi:predicted neutral ceramidase superfamily lipid hydrolase
MQNTIVSFVMKLFQRVGQVKIGYNVCLAKNWPMINVPTKPTKLHLFVYSISLIIICQIHLNLNSNMFLNIFCLVLLISFIFLIFFHVLSRPKYFGRHFLTLQM